VAPFLFRRRPSSLHRATPLTSGHVVVSTGGAPPLFYWPRARDSHWPMWPLLASPSCGFRGSTCHSRVPAVGLLVTATADLRSQPPFFFFWVLTAHPRAGSLFRRTLALAAHSLGHHCSTTPGITVAFFGNRPSSHHLYRPDRLLSPLIPTWAPHRPLLSQASFTAAHPVVAHYVIPPG